MKQSIEQLIATYSELDNGFEVRQDAAERLEAEGFVQTGGACKEAREYVRARQRLFRSFPKWQDYKNSLDAHTQSLLDDARAKLAIAIAAERNLNSAAGLRSESI